MKIVTWNLSWQSMSDKKKRKQIIKCIKNIVIDHDPDVICFQEASGLVSIRKALPNWGHISGRSGMEDIAIFWKTDLPIKWYFGQFEKGRPYMYILFDNYEIFNVHLGHNNEKVQLELIDRELRRSKSSAINFSTIVGSKLKTNSKSSSFLSVIAGDFNTELSQNSNTICDKTYNEDPTKSLTCCGYNPNDRKKMFDHILTTSSPSYTKISLDEKKCTESSDHLPLLAII